MHNFNLEEKVERALISGLLSCREFGTFSGMLAGMEFLTSALFKDEEKPLSSSQLVADVPLLFKFMHLSFCLYLQCYIKNEIYLTLIVLLKDTMSA